MARGRKKTRDEVHALAQGRVWTGKDAHAHGLVDLLGGFEVALGEVRRRLGKGPDSLPARVLRGNAKDSSTLSAKPAQEAALLAASMLGEWGEVLALATGRERVLVWAPEVVGFRQG